MLNGLNARYENIINVIMHHQPFPTFEEARSMLILEEERLTKTKKTSLVNNDSSSSEKILMAAVTKPDRKDQDQPQQTHQRNNYRGRGRGNNRGRGCNYNGQCQQYQQWNTPMWTNNYPMWQQQYVPWNPYQQPSLNQAGLLRSRPLMAQQQQPQAQMPPQQKFVPTVDFSQAFNTMTLVDPSDNQWYMDSGPLLICPTAQVILPPLLIYAPTKRSPLVTVVGFQ